MDAREQVESQPRRPSIKRPWDEEPSESAGIWHSSGLSLPPIDIVPYRRPSLSRAAEDEGNLHTRYNTGLREKRPRFEHDYNSLSRENLDLNGKILQAQASVHSIYNNPPRSSQELPSFRTQQHSEGWERQIQDPGQSAGSRESSNLCQRCRRLTTQRQDSEDVESCERCSDIPFLSLHAGDAAKALSQLEAKLLRETPIDDSEHHEHISADCPPIEQFGVRHTFNWLLDRIHQINDLADKFVQHVSPETSQSHDRNIIRTSSGTQDALISIMKRHIDAEQDDRSTSDTIDPTSDARIHTRRRSVASVIANSEDFHTMRSPHEYHGGHSNLDSQSRRASIMNPPPAPNRQLPSPPGRSLPSPTSINFPSPSAGSYGSSSNAGNLPPPPGLHQTSLNAYLPPIGSTHSPDALQAHSAALQHEVSVQKIALASLQGEHNKLLAAFSRSQTRASALEKKHQVSDTEIISLTEEKLRLESQVSELEKHVDELVRSRDEYRQAAVQGGAQYVEIVKKASRLEEMAEEERRVWASLKAEMEQRIESLTTRNTQRDSTNTAASSSALVMQVYQNLEDIATPPSSNEGQTSLKAEPATEPKPATPNRSQETDIKLKEEIRRLRSRCAEAEDALRAVRDDSRSMEGIIEALGLAGKSIIERADRTLGRAPRFDEAL